MYENPAYPQLNTHILRNDYIRSDYISASYFNTLAQFIGKYYGDASLFAILSYIFWSMNRDKMSKADLREDRGQSPEIINATVHMAYKHISILIHSRTEMAHGQI